ncbi:tyrosine-type recombinase/integrase [Olsenella sp. oral taxon 807]|uniref:tyrosine-type recombinase/integrase n=1 Tax=Olsenella sp. oral taxon 807 TaxID=712411 RepID=UPI0009F8D04D
MRAAEPVGATLGDLVVPSGAPAPVPARGKGRRERCIGPSDRADGRLRVYLDACHGEERDPSTSLSCTVVHGVMYAMSERNVERIVTKYGDVAREEHSGIQHTYPHMVRRTRATTPCRDGVPIERVPTLPGRVVTRYGARVKRSGSGRPRRRTRAAWASTDWFASFSPRRRSSAACTGETS